MHVWLSDLRRAARALIRTPGFALPVIATLALGFGSVAALFTIVNAILIRPLPYADADRIVALQHVAPAIDLARGDMSEATYAHYRAHNHVFEQIGVYLENAVNLTDGDQSERVPIAMVTPSVLTILGVKPHLGRLFNDQDDDGIVRVVMSHALWVRRYNADPTIVGRTIRTNTVTPLVVGVLPQGFDFPRTTTGLWYQDSQLASSPRVRDFYLKGLARLKRGVTIATAEADLRALVPSMAGLYKDATPEIVGRGGLQPIVMPLKEEIIGSIRLPLTILFCAMGLVLLISWANVANLFLVRGEARRKEVALHRALGASTIDLMRTAFVDSLLLAVPAAAIGAIVAQVSVVAMVEMTTVAIPRMHEVRMDAVVIAVTVGLTLMTSVLLAIFTLARVGRVNLTTALASAGRQVTAGGGGGGRGGARARFVQRGLVASQIALALIVVIGSSVMLQSLSRLRAVPLGFDSEDALTFRFSLPTRAYPTFNQAVAFHERLLGELRGMAGVADAAMTLAVPLTPDTIGMSVALDGAAANSVAGNREAVRADESGAVLPGMGVAPRATFTLVTPGYFDLMRMRIVNGRGFDPASEIATEIPVVISQALADALVAHAHASSGAGADSNSNSDAGATAIGRHLRVLERGKHPPYVVIGVVNDVVGASLTEGPARAIYAPIARVAAGGVKPYYTPGGVTVVMRTRVPPTSTVPVVRQALRALDPRLAISDVRTLRAIVDESTAWTRLTTTMLIVAAGAGLMLALIGVGGLTAYTVSRRRRELAVRVALGARPVHIRSLVLSGVIVTVAIGIAVGLYGSFVLTRSLGALLFQVSPHDPATFIAAPLLVLAIALAAGYLPSRRAARIDPATALRAE